MAINLTDGAIEAINAGNNDIQPILQVADVRLVTTKTTMTNTERYRLLLSDGVYLQQSMLATQRNELVRNGVLQKGSIVRLVQFVKNNVQQRTIIVIIDLEVIQETWPSIGEPVMYMINGNGHTPQLQASVGQTGMIPGNVQHVNPQGDGSGPTYRPNESLQLPNLERGVQMQSYTGSSVTPESGRLAQMQSYAGSSAITPEPGRSAANNGSVLHNQPQISPGYSGNAAVGGSYGGYNSSRIDVSHAPSFGRHQLAPYQPQPSYMNRGPIAKNEAPSRIIPIAALNPFNNRWTIKARVTAKTELRHYNNARGDGKVFSFDLLDSDGGEIRVTCFNAVADQFYVLIEAGKVFLISKGSVKPAQKNFNHLSNDHEIHLDITSVVEPCFDDDSRIPRQLFHFRPISEIEGMDNKSIVDVIGLVTSISSSSSLMTKRGTETQKRRLQLKDMSGRSVELTLWGNFCNAEGQMLQNLRDGGSFPVLAIKAARVSDFNGKAVETFFSSQLFVEPDFPEAQKLKGWFDMEGRNLPSVPISRETIGSGRTDVRKTITQIKDEKLGTSEKPDWITVCASLSFIKMDNFCYPACPIQIGDRRCNKKVTNNGDGKWRCEKCDQSVDECEYRYMLQFQIQDHTGVTWATAFQECAEEILGIPAKNLYHLKHEEQDVDKFQEIIRAALFHKYIFKLKVKEEIFNDEQRVKSTAMKAERANFVSEFRSIMDLMQKVKVGDSGATAARVENATPNIGTDRSGIGHSVSHDSPLKPAFGGMGGSSSNTSQHGNQYSGGYAGMGQSSVSGVNCGLPRTPAVTEVGGFSGNTSQYGNQYTSGYSGTGGVYVTCSSCGGTGHSSTNCPSIINGPGQPSGGYSNQAVPQANAGGGLGQCFKCQKFGHYARDCPGQAAGPPANGGGTIAPGRYGVQKQHVGGF